MSSTPKRPCPQDDAEPDADLPVTRSELDQLLEEHSQRIQASTSTLIKSYDKSVQNRFKSVETEVRGIRDAVSEQQRNTEELAASVKLLEKAISKAEEIVSDPSFSFDDNFDRKPDMAVLRISSSEMVSRDSVVGAVCDWLGEADFTIGTNLDLIAAPLSRNFMLKFTGAFGPNRASKAFKLLRDTAGVWREFEVVSPSGKRVRIYVSLDKNAKKIKEEGGAKRLATIFRNKFPGSTPATIVNYNRRDSSISLGWTQVARVVAHGKDKPLTLEWNYTGVTSLSDQGIPLDKEAIKLEFQAYIGAPASSSTSWGI
jgi:hypothetical protein